MESEGSERRIAYIVSMAAGLEAFIYREVETLDRHDVPILLFATKFRKNDIYAPKEGWEYHTLVWWQLLLWAPFLMIRLALRPALTWSAFREGGLADLVIATHFTRILRRRGVTQIHCHFGDHKLFIGYYCKRLTGLPLSVTIHAHEFYTNPNAQLFRKVLGECDRIFPIASRWQARLMDEYGVPADKLRLNRLFVDTNKLIPSKAVRVISVGRFTERKGFQYILEAAQQLHDVDVEFIFVGFGSMDLEGLSRDFGVSDRVTVFRKMNEAQLRIMYQTADILCVPSITTEAEGAEGIPVVLMEGMACGLPVVATPCGAIAEIVEDTLVEERDSGALAEAIRMLAGDETMRQQQGRRNREIVLERFSEANVHKFKDELLSIPAGRRKYA